VPIQNHDAFGWLDVIVDQQLASFETAGYLHGGKTVWMLLKLPHQLQILGTDDVVTPYLLAVNTHDGSRAMSTITIESAEKWFVAAANAGTSETVRNEHRKALIAFGNWCVKSKRMLTNPFATLSRADERSNPRRRRRALREDEPAKLLCVAAERPLNDRRTVYRG
jgi:hypothetical protein